MRRGLGNTKWTAKTKCSREILHWGTRILYPKAMVHDCSCTWLPGCSLLTARMVRQEQVGGTRVSKLGDADPFEEIQLLPGPGPLQSTRSQGHRVTFGAELHWLPQASMPPSLAWWVCLQHPSVVRGVRGGKTVLKHPGFTDLLKTAKLTDSLNQGLPFFICWLFSNHIMFSTNLKKLKKKKYNYTVQCWQAGERK